MHVNELSSPDAIRTAIVLNSSTDPHNVIYFALRSGGSGDAGVSLSKYTLEDGRYTVDEVLAEPKRRVIRGEEDPEYTEEDVTVTTIEDITNYMEWDTFQDKFGSYEIISSDKNLDFTYVG